MGNQALDGQLGEADCCLAKDILHKGRAHCNFAVYIPRPVSRSGNVKSKFGRSSFWTNQLLQNQL